MGHAEKSEHLNLRNALVLQRRITTFSLGFSVALVVLMMTLTSLQYRDASCQDRASEVVLDILLRPDLSKAVIVNAISEVLAARLAVLDMDVEDASPGIKTVEMLDTSDSIIAANGFRLLHRTDGSNYNYELRAIFDRLCGSKPTISMEVLGNVDYEKVVYHIKAISLMGQSTKKFMLESRLTTKDASRITTVAQLQSLFPGFISISSSGKLSVSASFTYTGGGGGQVYYNGQPLDVAVGIEQWFGKDSKPLFWRVTLSTANLFAEGDLVSLEESLQTSFRQNDFVCAKECAGVFNVYLR